MRKLISKMGGYRPYVDRDTKPPTETDGQSKETEEEESM
jgi:hypothetical protein